MTADVGGWLAHEQGICAVTWSPDGARLATGGNDGLVRVWSVDEAGKVARTMSAHRGSVRALAWMPGAPLLASGGEDGAVRVWDGATGELVATPQQHARWVNAVAWSPDGRRLAAAGGDRTVTVTDLRGAVAAPCLRSPYGVILSLAWAPDGEHLAGAGRSSLLSVWQATSGRVHAELDNGPGAIWSVCWLDDGGTLATGNALGLVRVWDRRSQRRLQTIRAHGAAVARVSWSRAGDVLATLSHDQTIALWDLGTGRRVQHIEPAYPGWTGCLEASPTAALIAGTDRSGREVRLWRITEPDGQSPPAPASELRARVAAAVRGRSGWVTVRQLTSALVREHPALATLATPESWVRCILAQLACEEDDVLFAADAGLAALQPERIRALARRVTAEASGGVVDVGEALERSLRRRPELGAGFEAAPGLLSAFVACAAVRSRLGWLAGRDGLRLQIIPELDPGAPAEGSTAVETLTLTWTPVDGASPPAARWIFTTILSTTLFVAWTLRQGQLVVRTGDGARCWIAWARTGGAGCALGLASTNGELREALAAMMAARMARECPALGAAARASSAGAGAAVSEADWEAWDGEAATWWSLTADELAGGPAEMTAVLDERVDDELARQERLAFARVLDADHAVLWHVPAMAEAAAGLAHALAVGGVKVSCHDVAAVAPRSLAARSEAVNAVVVLLGPEIGTWDASPLAEPYREVARRDAETGRRTRWLPVAAGGDAWSATGVPDHLRSFDWYRWHRTDAQAQRGDGRALVGGILLDRTRS